MSLLSSQALKKTQSTIPNQRPGPILSSSTTGLLKFYNKRSAVTYLNFGSWTSAVRILPQGELRQLHGVTHIFDHPLDALFRTACTVHAMQLTAVTDRFTTPARHTNLHYHHHHHHLEKL